MVSLSVSQLCPSWSVGYASLAKYLARELSQKIKNHEITNIEGGFLVSQNI